MKEYTDRCFENLEEMIVWLRCENSSQLSKWGVQTHSAFEWLTYTAEELGELAQAIGDYEYRDGKAKDVKKEAIQLATLALKIAEMMEE